MTTVSKYNNDNDPYREVHTLLNTIRYRKKLDELRKKHSKNRDFPELPILPDPNIPRVDPEEKVGINPTVNEHEDYVRTKIKTCMNKWRQKRREERIRKREEMIQRFEEKMREKYGDNKISPQNSLSTSDTPSSRDDGASVATSRTRRHEILQKMRDRTFPMQKVFEEVRKNMEHETILQYEFLETIRILRGVGREEFYSDINKEGEGDHADDGDQEGAAEEKQAEKKIGARIDSRWPKGHIHYTLPKTDDKVPPKLHKLLDIAYDLHQNIRKKIQYREMIYYKQHLIHDVQTHHHRNVTFEHWRERMLKIAYDEKYARGKSKVFQYESWQSTRPLHHKRILRDVFEERAEPIDKYAYQCNHGNKKETKQLSTSKTKKTSPYVDQYYAKNIFASKQRLLNQKRNDQLKRYLKSKKNIQAQETLLGKKSSLYTDDKSSSKHQSKKQREGITILKQINDAQIVTEKIAQTLNEDIINKKKELFPELMPLKIDDQRKKDHNVQKKKVKNTSDKKSENQNDEKYKSSHSDKEKIGDSKSFSHENSDTENQKVLPKRIKKREKRKIISDTDEIPKLIDCDSSDDSSWLEDEEGGDKCNDNKLVKNSTSYKKSDLMFIVNAKQKHKQEETQISTQNSKHGKQKLEKNNTED